MTDVPRVPKIHGIPTIYRGIRFRSRTEARWAVLFDELGWSWQFEPFDLNGYIPDFVLRFEEGPLLVEVKGHVIEPHALGEHTGKLETSGWDGEVLIVGAAPWEFDSAQPLIGWFGERVQIEDEKAWSWGDARAFSCLSCGQLSVLPAAGDWRCRICGADGGNAHVGAAPALSETWAASSNRVQWRPEA